MDLVNFINELFTDYEFPKQPFFKVNLKNYPSSIEIREMIQFYLFMFYNQDLVKNIPNDEKFPSKVRSMIEYKEFDQKLVDQYFDLVPLYGQIINAFWFFWSLFYMIPRNIGFDFGQFAVSKYELYHWFKKKSKF